MEKIVLTEEEWVRLYQTTQCQIPAWIQVKGNSMFPFIRAFKDDILLLPADKSRIKLGDIVFF